MDGDCYLEQLDQLLAPPGFSSQGSIQIKCCNDFLVLHVIALAWPWDTAAITSAMLVMK